MSADILALQHVAHAFQGVNGQEVQVLRNITLKLTPGTFTCLVGPSGCGKSTLLRIAAGLVQPQHGAALFRDRPLNRPQREISMVFQHDNLMPWRTVQQNIMLPLELARIDHELQQQQTADWINLTGLAGFEHYYPAELSGGMRQRVAIARGLITKPALLLLDEPFGALDAMTRELMWQELLRIWQTTRATVLMVTHSIREAILLADRVLVMSPRPGTITAAFDVPFERPRDLALLTANPFNTLEAQVRAAISR